MVPCPHGWGPSPRTAFYRPHRPRESLGACYGSADLVVSLLRWRPGPAETRAATVESRRYGTLHAAAHNRLQDSEVVRLQCEMDRMKLQQWLQHTANILNSMLPRGELRRDVVQMRRFNRLCGVGSPGLCWPSAAGWGVGRWSPHQTAVGGAADVCDAVSGRCSRSYSPSRHRGAGI